MVDWEGILLPTPKDFIRALQWLLPARKPSPVLDTLPLGTLSSVRLYMVCAVCLLRRCVCVCVSVCCLFGHADRPCSVRRVPDAAQHYRGAELHRHTGRARRPVCLIAVGEVTARRTCCVCALQRCSNADCNNEEIRAHVTKFTYTKLLSMTPSPPPFAKYTTSPASEVNNLIWGFSKRFCLHFVQKCQKHQYNHSLCRTHLLPHRLRPQQAQALLNRFLISPV